MKKTLLKIVSIGLLSLFLVSCGKNNSYEQSMQKTKEAITEDKFEQAEAFVEMALESKPKEEEAKNYQKQLQSYNAAQGFKEKKETKNAIVKLNDVIDVKNGSTKLVEYAKLEKKELETKKEDVKKETSKNKKSKKKKETKNSLWNPQKADSLREFMVGFSQAMDQQYNEYTPSKNVDLYGVGLPKAVLGGDWTMAVNDQPVQVEWSDTGEGSKPYQLVAVYSDADTQPYLKKHVYFFVVENGVSKVYVTQQNQGNEQNYLHFSETQNADIKNGFSQIINGGSVAKPQPANNKEYKDGKLLAAKVMVKIFEDSNTNIDAFFTNSADVSYSLQQEDSMEIWNTGVYLPEKVTVITGSPLASGMFTYHNNGDGTVVIYPVPSHYQDKDWDDPVLGKEMAENVISEATIKDISKVSDESAEKMATFID